MVPDIIADLSLLPSPPPATRAPPCRLPHAQGFCFIKYENQRSTILAVDNFNGIELLGRTIRVDHKHKYSLPVEVRKRSLCASLLLILPYHCRIISVRTAEVPLQPQPFSIRTWYVRSLLFIYTGHSILSCAALVLEPGSCHGESTADATVGAINKARVDERRNG